MDKIKHTERYFEVAPGVWGLKIVFVNLYMVASDDHWVLIDTGLPWSGRRIIQMAEELFGGTAPAAILMTHGHFDHRGAVEQLSEKWNVPVYAHQMELPYLNGKSAYPPPDSTVGGGIMSLLSVFYPKRPINLGNRLKVLPADGSLPFLPGWVTIYTPGHSPGHVSFFREADRLLIAGDAFVTTKQESALATLMSLKKICGPPRYFTPDWPEAKASVKKLVAVDPATAATGHGPPMCGAELNKGLNQLANHFNELAKPAFGRYANEPAKANNRGVQYVPPLKFSNAQLTCLVLTCLLAFIIISK